MIVIGLTGSIGMGKSTVARMLKKLGCAVHDSDKAVHHALSPKGEAFEEVAVTFPTSWDKKTHTIRRDILGQIVFDDESKRIELEKILHPVVRRAQKKFIHTQQVLGKKIAVLDIPLLFETGAQNRVDYTIVASAPYHVQRRRVLGRKNMDADKFQKILAAQMSDREKCIRADFVVHTGMGMAYTYRQLQKFLESIK